MLVELHQLELRHEGLRVSDLERLSRLTASLSAHGQQQPLLVVRDGAGYVLIDGYRRARALAAMGRDRVAIQVLEMDEREALIFCHRRHRATPRDALEEGWLARELTTTHGMSARGRGRVGPFDELGVAPAGTGPGPADLGAGAGADRRGERVGGGAVLGAVGTR